MSPRLFAFGTGAFTMFLSAQAFAVAMHNNISMKPIKDKGKVVGARFTMEVHPENYSQFRLIVGQNRLLKPSEKKTNQQHRRLAAGLVKGYAHQVLKLSEVTGPKPTDRGKPTETLGVKGVTEVEAVVMYGRGNKLKGGETIDLVGTFSTNMRTGGPHTIGMHDGPVQKGTRGYVFTLPGGKK